MRWEVKTEKKIYIINATSSKSAVEAVKLEDVSSILHVKLLPKNTFDKVKSQWRKLFVK